MKKLLILSLTALALLALGEQKASAWSKFSLTAGLNISYISSGNCFLWGAVQTSPYPGPYGDGAVIDPAYSGQYGDVDADGGQAPTTPAAGGEKKIEKVDYQSSWYGQNGYQPVSYYPSAYYGYYAAPSYWYGR